MTLDTAKGLIRRRDFYEGLFVVLFIASTVGSIVCFGITLILGLSGLPMGPMMLVVGTLFILTGIFGLVTAAQINGLLTSSVMKELYETATKVLNEEKLRLQKEEAEAFKREFEEQRRQAKLKYEVARELKLQERLLDVQDALEELGWRRFAKGFYAKDGTYICFGFLNTQEIAKIKNDELINFLPEEILACAEIIEEE